MNKRPAATTVALRGNGERTAGLGQMVEQAARLSWWYAHAFGKLRAGKHVVTAVADKRVDAREMLVRYTKAGRGIFHMSNIKRICRGATFRNKRPG